jgi:hypothetical protein
MAQEILQATEQQLRTVAAIQREQDELFKFTMKKLLQLEGFMPTLAGMNDVERAQAQEVLERLWRMWQEKKATR